MSVPEDPHRYCFRRSFRSRVLRAVNAISMSDTTPFSCDLLSKERTLKAVVSVNPRCVEFMELAAEIPIERQSPEVSL